MKFKTIYQKLLNMLGIDNQDDHTDDNTVTALPAANVIDCINIICESDCIGKIQSLEVKDVKTIYNCINYINGSAYRLRIDKDKIDGLFDTSTGTFVQAKPIDIEVTATYETLPVKTKIQNVWIKPGKYTYYATDFVLFEEVEWESNNMTSAFID